MRRQCSEAVTAVTLSIRWVTPGYPDQRIQRANAICGFERWQSHGAFQPCQSIPQRSTSAGRRCARSRDLSRSWVHLLRHGLPNTLRRQLLVFDSAATAMELCDRGQLRRQPDKGSAIQFNGINEPSLAFRNLCDPTRGGDPRICQAQVPIRSRTFQGSKGRPVHC